MATRGKPSTKEAKLLDMLYGKPAAGDLRNTPMLTRTGEGSYLRQQYPEVYGAGAGLLGTLPDDISGSVLDPNTARVKQGAVYGLPTGVALDALPLAGPALKGAKMTGKALGSGLNEAIYHGAQSPLSKFIPESAKPLYAVKPKGGESVNLSNSESFFEKLLQTPMSRRSALKTATSPVIQNLLGTDTLISKELSPALDSLEKILSAKPASAVTLSPAVKTSAQNFLANTENINRLGDARARAQLLQQHVLPEGMTLKEFMRQVKSDPDTYNILMKDLKRLGNEERYVKANSLDRDMYAETLKDLPAGAVAKELQLWDKYKGNFPTPIWLGENIKPRLFDAELGNPEWFSNLPKYQQESIGSALEGIPYKEAQAMLAPLGKFMRANKLDSLDGINIPAVVRAGLTDEKITLQQVASPDVIQRLDLVKQYKTLDKKGLSFDSPEALDLRKQIVELNGKDPAVAKFSEELQDIQTAIDRNQYTIDFLKNIAPDDYRQQMVSSAISKLPALKARQSSIEDTLKIEIPRFNAQPEFNSTPTTEPVTNPFWYNPKSTQLETFDPTNTHTKSLMDPDYAAKIGVAPLDPSALNLEHGSLLMGRTEKTAPNTLNLMQVDELTPESLTSIQKMLSEKNIPHEKISLSGGSSLYENLPAELVRSAKTIEDLKKYRMGGEEPPAYKTGGSVTTSDIEDEKAAFGVYPNAGKRSQKSDIGDRLNASLIPQDALDLAMTIAPFGKVGKTLAAAIVSGAPIEAQAGNMSSLLKLVAKEAPEQFHSIREALLRTFNTGLEHSVVGSTRTGGPSQVVQGVEASVVPNRLDVVNARRNIDQSGLIDFHTHPRQNNSVSEFKITPSDTDLQTWMSQYGGSRTATTPNEIKTMVGSPPSRQDGVTSAYNFFATNKPNQTLDRRAYDAARYELQRSKALQSLKDIPEVRQYLDTGGTLGDVLSSASPMVLQKLYAQKGLGRHDMRLSNAPVAGPLGTESNLFNEIANPAIEVLKAKRFAEGGSVFTLAKIKR
jgi:hypothetical protein